MRATAVRVAGAESQIAESAKNCMHGGRGFRRLNIPAFGGQHSLQKEGGV